MASLESVHPKCQLRLPSIHTHSDAIGDKEGVVPLVLVRNSGLPYKTTKRQKRIYVLKEYTNVHHVSRLCL